MKGEIEEKAKTSKECGAKQRTPEPQVPKANPGLHAHRTPLGDPTVPRSSPQADYEFTGGRTVSVLSCPELMTFYENTHLQGRGRGFTLEHYQGYQEIQLSCTEAH